MRPRDGREGRFFVECSYPHRIVKWVWKPGAAANPLGGTDRAELTGCTRLEYWKIHDPGDETHLESLGIPPGVK